MLRPTWNSHLAVYVPGPPGAGKTRLTLLPVAALSHRAGIAAQTRAQAIDIARRLAAVSDHPNIGLLWAKTGLKARHPRARDGAN